VNLLRKDEEREIGRGKLNFEIMEVKGISQFIMKYSFDQIKNRICVGIKVHK
jgi:hypothetical protein